MIQKRSIHVCKDLFESFFFLNKKKQKKQKKNK